MNVISRLTSTYNPFICYSPEEKSSEDKGMTEKILSVGSYLAHSTASGISRAARFCWSHVTPSNVTLAGLLTGLLRKAAKFSDFSFKDMSVCMTPLPIALLDKINQLKQLELKSTGFYFVPLILNIVTGNIFTTDHKIIDAASLKMVVTILIKNFEKQIGLSLEEFDTSGHTIRRGALSFILDDFLASSNPLGKCAILLYSLTDAIQCHQTAYACHTTAEIAIAYCLIRGINGIIDNCFKIYS